MKLTRTDLSKDQAAVYEAILDWTRGRASIAKPKTKQLAFDFNPPTILTMGGFAGTGKSTLIGVLSGEFKKLVAYVAYTGRASSVLHRKLKAAGAPTTSFTRPTGEYDERYHDPSLPVKGGPSFVGTIHRLLYAPIINQREELIGWRRRLKLDREYDLIVCDEASMVGDDLLNDLMAHKVPLLAVGDHGQLPPVMATGELMKDPDLKLEKIHRQAEKNPIIKLSRIMREEGYLDEDLDDKKHIRFRPKSKLEKVLRESYEHAEPIDIGLICYTNRKRIQLNATARTTLGFKATPKKGEVLICLKNDPPIFNGMRGVLTAKGKLDEEHPWILHTTIAFPEEGIEAFNIEACAATFNRERPFDNIEEIQALGIPAKKFSDAGHPYDFGYAMTCHKSQGSQFSHVVLFLDRPVEDNEDSRRYFYTAVTRASEKLTVLT